MSSNKIYRANLSLNVWCEYFFRVLCGGMALRVVLVCCEQRRGGTGDGRRDETQKATKPMETIKLQR